MRTRFVEPENLLPQPPPSVEGRLLRILALIDEYRREYLVLCVERRLNSPDVIERLSDRMLWRGIPEQIR